MEKRALKWTLGNTKDPSRKEARKKKDEIISRQSTMCPLRVAERDFSFCSRNWILRQSGPCQDRVAEKRKNLRT